MKIFLKNTKKFLCKEHHEKMILLQAYAYVIIAKVIIILFPFKFYSKMLGAPINPNSDYKLENNTTVNIEKIKAISAAVNTISYFLPFQKKCLSVAMGTAFMLKKNGIGSTLYLGVKKKDYIYEKSQLEAHAWVNSEDISVIGGNGWGYTIISIFKK